MDWLDAFNNILAYDNVEGPSDDLEDNQAYVDAKREYDSSHKSLAGTMSSMVNAINGITGRNSGIIEDYERPEDPAVDPGIQAYLDERNGGVEAQRNKNANDFEMAVSSAGLDVNDPYFSSVAESLRTTDAGNGDLVGDYLDSHVVRGTPEPVRDVYERAFMNPVSIGRQIVNGIGVGLPNTVKAAKDNEFVQIDMGRGEADREKPYMTGQQYALYREIGLPGRPVEDINPNAIYSKYQEMNDNGFIPYLVTEEGGRNFTDVAVSDSVNNAVNNLANWRRDTFDYSVNYGGKKLSGHDFEDSYRTWKSRESKSASGNLNGVTMYTGSPHSSASVPVTFAMIDSNTNEVVYLPDNAEIAIDEATGNPKVYPHDRAQGLNGPFYIDLGNGQTWEFENLDDYRQTFLKIPAEIGGINRKVVGYVDREPLVLSDGTTIRADKADELADNLSDYADYNKNDFNSPDPDMLSVPGFVDLVLGSAPIFTMYTGLPMGAANASANLRGMRPGAQNRSGEYRMLSENPRADQVYGSALGSALMPLTEQLWGPIGGKLSKTFPGAKAISRKLGSRGADIYEHPLTQWATGVVGEGLEEIPGNLAEEVSRYGLTADLFATPQKTADGNIMYDRQGRQMRNADDSIGRRLFGLGNENSFLGQAPESMAGGSLMGAVLGLPSIIMPRAWRRAKDRRNERRETGYNIDQF